MPYEKAGVDWDSFAVPSERGKNVDGYMREMRENDREIIDCDNFKEVKSVTVDENKH
jgi:hypothetical protein